MKKWADMEDLSIDKIKFTMLEIVANTLNMEVGKENFGIALYE
jgi:hypothetical protein